MQQGMETLEKAIKSEMVRIMKTSRFMALLLVFLGARTDGGSQTSDDGSARFEAQASAEGTARGE